MTREDINQDILKLKGKNFLIELATGTGKSKVAIEKIKQLSGNTGNLLIVVPRNVLKKNWADELNKWWPDCKLDITFSTYVSLPKQHKNWNFAIFDECHHLSERCREALCDFTIGHSILLSATVGKTLKDELKEVFNNIVAYKKDLRDVIKEEILPDPKVFLLKLSLKWEFPTESIWKNTKSKGPLIECNFKERWKYIRQNNFPVRVYCTEVQYYEDLCSQILYWKNLFKRTGRPLYRNKWLKLCNDRLKWLSDKKTLLVKSILTSLTDYRTLTFCNSIEQTEQLGQHCINSKNKLSAATLQAFNNGEINHITACNMLNEGMNLSDCQIGIYANLNSSETIIKQRMGRLLRHSNPVIIIPYYVGTRDEELVEKMMEDYNPELITRVNIIEDIRI